MTKCVIEVGPGTVRGPCEVDQDLASTALECIDDDIALLDEQPVAVSEIWRAVFRALLSDCVGTAVLVCPSWWSSSRVERVQLAAAKVVTEVVVLQRAQVLVDHEADAPTVVEIAPEFVVVWRSGRVLTAEPRWGKPANVARAVANCVGAASTVLVDAPVGVDHARELAGAISECIRAEGSAVTTVHRNRVLAGVSDQPMRWVRESGAPGLRGTRAAVFAAVAISVALLCVGVARSNFGGPNAGSVPMTLLVEGRVVMKVPAEWAVRRITSGPGSARVEVMAPGGTAAVLVTQSQVRRGERLSETAAALRSALDDQQADIFSQFNPDDRRADRPAATYLEARGDRQIDWTVFVDGTARIAVGCQSAPGREQAVRNVCDEVIRSAHSVV